MGEHQTIEWKEVWHYGYGMSGLMLTFHANPAQLAESLGKMRVETRVEPEKIRVKTPEKILALLAATPDLTLAEIANKLDKAVSTIERAVAKLSKEGRLLYVGPKKGGYWEIVE